LSPYLQDTNKGYGLEVSVSGILVALADFFYMISCPLAGYLALNVTNHKMLFLIGLIF